MHDNLVPVEKVAAKRLAYRIGKRTEGLSDKYLQTLIDPAWTEYFQITAYGRWILKIRMPR